MKILITEKQKLVMEQISSPISSVRVLSPKQKDYCLRFLTDILGDADFLDLETTIHQFKKSPNKDNANTIAEYIDALPKFLFIHTGTNKVTNDNRDTNKGWIKIAVVDLLGLTESDVVGLSKYGR